MDEQPLNMKEAFKQSMSYLYPGAGGVSRDQMRDLVRTFSMGWVEGLRAHNQVEAVREWAEGLGLEVSNVGWWPDETWIWWTSLDSTTN